jgi:hypothetical protein
MGSILALQEALTFEEEGNKTIHYFSDSEALFKCEGGFYNTGQILALRYRIKLDLGPDGLIRLNNIIQLIHMSDRSNPKTTSWYSISS